VGLTLVTGRANSGKTGFVHGRVLAALDASRAPALLLPTAQDVSRARLEFATSTPVGVRIDRLQAYVDEQWALLGDGRAVAGRLQRTALIGEATRSVPLRLMARSAARPSFASTFEPVFARLAEYPRSRLAASSDTDDEILALYDRYREALSSGDLLDRGEAMRLMATMRPLDDLVALHRFTDLSPAQEAMAVGWSAAGAEVIVSLPYEDGCPATEATSGLVGRLLGAGARHEPTTSPEHRTDALGRLERGLYARARSGDPDGTVVFVEAAGEEAESALVAERVEALLEGTSGSDALGPDRIAVAFRDPARRLIGLRRAFAARGIPVNLDVQVPLASTPLGAALCQLLGFFSSPDRRDLLVALLHGPFTDADQAEVDAVEAAWRRSAQSDRQILAGRASELGRGTKALLEAGGRLARDRVRREDLGRWKGLLDLMLATAFSGRRLVETERGVECATAHRRLLEHIEELAGLGDLAPGASRLPSLLADARASVFPGDRPGRVTVTEAHRLRSTRFDAIVVGGLSADEFSSQDRASFPAEIASRLSGSEPPTDQSLERLLFYQVCTRARRRLELVRMTSDSHGVEKRASVFWEEALDLFRDPDPDEREMDTPERLLADVLSLGLLERAAPLVSGDRRAARARARTLDAELGTDRVRRISDDVLLAELAGRSEFSVTELETYAQCAYRWFYDREVGRDELDVELDARIGGTIVHEALKTTYELMPEETGSRRVTAASLPAAQALFERVLDGLVDAHLDVSSLADLDLVDGARRRGLDSLAADADRFPAFEPFELEWGFGERFARPVDLGGFSVRGRIDRIDRSERGLVVLDYKWSRGPESAKFEDRRVVQLPLYAAAAEALLGEPVVAGLYVGLGSGRSRGWWLDVVADKHGDLVGTDRVSAEDGRDLVGSAIERARHAVEGIRAGRIAPEDPAADACRYCGAVATCGRSRV
jgi:RecB family exonuclease